MNTIHFRYALEVAKTASITQAADNLYMAQPNLSRAIRELEETVGISIFKRTPKGMVPTEKGLEFLEYARKVIDHIEKIGDLHEEKEDGKQYFRISIPRVSYVVAAVARFMADLDQDRGFLVNVRESSSLNAIASITDGQFDVGVIRCPMIYEKYFDDFLKQKGLKQELIWKFNYVVIMSKGHPLEKYDEITSKMLQQYTEIVHGDTSIHDLQELDMHRRAGALDSQNNKKMFVYDRMSQFTMVSFLDGAFMRSSKVTKAVLDDFGFVQRKYVGRDTAYKDLLVYPKSYTLNALDKVFVAKLHEVRDELIEL